MKRAPDGLFSRGSGLNASAISGLFLPFFAAIPRLLFE
jgi:hypothetical protein